MVVWRWLCIDLLNIGWINAVVVIGSVALLNDFFLEFGTTVKSLFSFLYIDSE